MVREKKKEDKAKKVGEKKTDDQPTEETGFPKDSPCAPRSKRCRPSVNDSTEGCAARRIEGSIVDHSRQNPVIA